MSKKRLITGLGMIVAVGLGLWLRSVLFSLGCDNMPATDDECIIALQAKQIARGDYSLLMLAQPYLFPLEAYLMAPFVDVLPRTAFGARVMAFSLGLVSALLGWLILRRWGSLSDIWPGLLLLIFSSPFLMILQYGVALPGYPSLLFLASMMVWLAQRYEETPAASRWAAFGVGFLGGLACSVTLLALPVLVMAGAMVGLHRHWRVARWTVPLVGLGTVTGSVPYWLARMMYGGAGDAVFRMNSWSEALHSLVSSTLAVTVPATLGLGCPVVPGSLERVEGLSFLAPFYGWIWLVALGWVTVKALIVAWRRCRRDGWLSVDAGLVFTGVAWLCLLMFIFSSRSGENTYRYLALIAWSWPFLMAYWYCHSGWHVRVGIGILAALMLLVNLHASAGLLKYWGDVSFASKLKAHDLAPVIRLLDSRGIRHAYSTYADAYRLTYMTDERIVCAQLYNERFPAWPLPYKTAVVDPATNVAYVLSEDTRFAASTFERDMVSSLVTCRVERCGSYKVYMDFGSLIDAPGDVLFSRADASHSHDDVKERLNEPDRFWRSEGALQQKGMWVSVNWHERRQVGHVLLNHGVFVRDCPDTVHVYYEAKGQWVKLPDPLSCLSVPFMFSNGHPVYGAEMTRLDFPYPVETKGLKLEIDNPRTHRAWTICQIDLAP